MKLTHIFCGRNAEFRSVTAGGLYSYHYAMYHYQIHNIFKTRITQELSLYPNKYTGKQKVVHIKILF